MDLLKNFDKVLPNTLTGPHNADAILQVTDASKVWIPSLGFHSEIVTDEDEAFDYVTFWQRSRPG